VALRLNVDEGMNQPIGAAQLINKELGKLFYV
jgi:hypothetical protein